MTTAAICGILLVILFIKVATLKHLFISFNIYIHTLSRRKDRKVYVISPCENYNNYEWLLSESGPLYVDLLHSSFGHISVSC